MRELGHVRFGMRRAALRGRPFDVRSLESLDEALFGDLRFDADQLVVVPPPGLKLTEVTSRDITAGGDSDGKDGSSDFI